MVEENLLFRHPCNIVVVGPTGSGKTVFTRKLIEQIEYLFKPVPEQIIWCYSEQQEAYQHLDNVIFKEGVPNIDLIRQDIKTPKLLILDDLMTNVKANSLTDLFIKGSHHCNTTIVNLVQNLFYDGLRTARINSHYLILMRNPNEKSQIRKLAQQLFPEDKSFLISAYNDATRKPYSYLLIDLHQKTPDNLRLRSNIFNDQFCEVYQPV